ncbi:MAG: transcription antitermination factor NusB [Methylobacillus sp.]|jgi:N utilization substance protein B|nr:transcription antitermination factor NusB [Methylobacillus sp.]
MSEKPAPKPAQNRRKSRELALKGLYSLFIGKGDLHDIVESLKEDEDYAHADIEYFQDLLNGAAQHGAELDAQIAPLLDRDITELSPIEHAILCIAAFELVHDASIPYRVAINEGVELAKRYGGTDGYKYVNGVLDKLATVARPNEAKRSPIKRGAPRPPRA